MKIKAGNSSAAYTILFADDHLLIHEAISNYINTFEEFVIIGQASNGAQLKEMILAGTIPHLVLLDLEMPVLNGYETATWLKQHFPAIKILMLSAFDSEAAKAIAFACGVDGFLAKAAEPAVMKEYLRNIVTGNHHQKAPYILSFTARELELLKLICTDLTYVEIAKEMHSSLRSVEHLRESLFDKSAIKSRTVLALYAVRNGLVPA